MLVILFNFFKKNPHTIILLLILIFAVFFRIYKVVDRFEFAHDGDLYSWIVKDIIVDGHIRLTGQETSASGIFIGPLFYYMLTPFFIAVQMDPVGAIIPITIIGIFTVLSYFIVFSKLFNLKVGLLAAFLYAILIRTSSFDRWVVPSTLSNLWTVWYFYIVILLSRGDFRLFPILGILTGLIWHIHIALIPSLIAVPTAIIFAKRLPTKKQFLQFLVLLFIVSIPLLAFEIRHNFQQTQSLISNFTIERAGASGIYKFTIVLDMISKNLNSLFFQPQSFFLTLNIFFPLFLIISALFLVKKNLLMKKEFFVFITWIMGIIAFFGISSSPISEYYFYNIEIIFFTIAVLFIYFIFISSRAGKVFVIVLFTLILLKNIYYLISVDLYHKGYAERKAVADFIVADASDRNFPCFSLNYITSPGENVGFRYFFYLKNAHIAVAGRGSPVYSIVIPEEYAKDEIDKKFGHIGVIIPKNIVPENDIKEACSGENTNLTDPMFGFVK